MVMTRDRGHLTAGGARVGSAGLAAGTYEIDPDSSANPTNGFGLHATVSGIPSGAGILIRSVNVNQPSAGACSVTILDGSGNTKAVVAAIGGYCAHLQEDIYCEGQAQLVVAFGDFVGTLSYDIVKT